MSVTAYLTSARHLIRSVHRLKKLLTRWKMDTTRQLQVGDRVELSDSRVDASGVVTKEFDRVHVWVQWGNSPAAALHLRSSLQLHREYNAIKRTVYV